MPRLNDPAMQEQHAGTSYSYSAVTLDKLNAMEYTLVGITVDISGSVSSYVNELEKCLSEIVKACKHSPRADNLMLRVTTFNNNEDELHGFKLFADCNPDDYKKVLHCGGMTALFDATYNLVEATNRYAKDLSDQNYAVNGITFVITDGADNASTMTKKKIKEALDKSVKGEVMESMVSVLIGVDADAGVKQFLDDFSKEANFTQYISMGQADGNKLAKLAEFVSKSISSQSNSLGSGGPSQAINLSF